MKTWEILKLATENPNIEFKMNGSELIYFVKNGEVRAREKGDATSVRSGSINFLTNSWELIPEEVTWQKAIQAWLTDNKGFFIELPNGEKYHQAGWQTLRGFDAIHFNKGKWYIE